MGIMEIEDETVADRIAKLKDRETHIKEKEEKLKIEAEKHTQEVVEWRKRYKELEFQRQADNALTDLLRKEYSISSGASTPVNYENFTQQQLRSILSTKEKELVRRDRT